MRKSPLTRWEIFKIVQQRNRVASSNPVPEVMGDEHTDIVHQIVEKPGCGLFLELLSRGELAADCSGVAEGLRSAGINPLLRYNPMPGWVAGNRRV